MRNRRNEIYKSYDPSVLYNKNNLVVKKVLKDTNAFYKPEDNADLTKLNLKAYTEWTEYKKLVLVKDTMDVSKTNTTIDWELTADEVKKLREIKCCVEKGNTNCQTVRRRLDTADTVTKFLDKPTNKDFATKPRQQRFGFIATQTFL